MELEEIERMARRVKLAPWIPLEHGDLVQEAWLRARLFVDDAKAKPAAHRAMQDAVRNAMRLAGFRRAPGGGYRGGLVLSLETMAETAREGTEVADLVPDGRVGPADVVAAADELQELRRRAREAVERTCAKAPGRAAVALARLSGLGPQESAAACGISEVNEQSAWLQAKRMMCELAKAPAADHAKCPLTAEQVQKIRTSAAKRGYRRGYKVELARRFGVSPSYIGKIVRHEKRSGWRRGKA